MTTLQPSGVNIPLEVRTRIARFSRKPEPSLRGDHKLLRDLGMQHPACVDLSNSLDRFVKLHNIHGRILVSDVEDSDATVDTTIALTTDQIAGKQR